MQKIIFFTPVVETGKLATIISDKSVNDLKKEGIIPNNSLTLIKNFDESNVDLQYSLYYIEYFTFNNNNVPTDIVFNKQLFEVYVLNCFREERKHTLAILDALQTRALLLNKPELVAEIEEDKITLRNIPNTIDWSNKLTVKDFYSNMPFETTIDYAAKYEEKLK
jgi:hypothetical protein